jgi:pSer/pThr/pTyr-binding forkhead associated (FHA) protein
MPYLVVNNDRQETEHREINGDLVIGRAPDCEVSVRDILLSRKHCKIQRSPQGWIVVDLGSKNGTVINGERVIEPKILQENDVVRVGRSKIVFHEGQLEPELASKPRPPRAADPGDSMSGTLSGFTLLMPGEGESSKPSNTPCPQPRPRDPASYQRDDVESLLSAIVSSSWDSIYAEARASTPMQARLGGEELAPRRRARPRSPIDLSLQVSSHPPAVSPKVRQPVMRSVPAILDPAPIEPPAKRRPVAPGQSKPMKIEPAPVEVVATEVVATKSSGKSIVPPPLEIESEPIALQMSELLPPIQAEAAAPAIEITRAADVDIFARAFVAPQEIQAVAVKAKPVASKPAPPAIIVTPRRLQWKWFARHSNDMPMGPARILTYVAAASWLLAGLVLISDLTSPSNGSTPGRNLPGPAVNPGSNSIPLNAIPAASTTPPSMPRSIAPAPHTQNRKADPAGSDLNVSDLKQSLSHPDPEALRATMRDLLLHSPIFFLQAPWMMYESRTALSPRVTPQPAQ